MHKSAAGRYVTTKYGQESVQAFVPDPLPPRVAANEFRALDDAVDKAEAAIRRLRITVGAISEPWLTDLFVRREAIASSAIEGINATLEDLLVYELRGKAVGSDAADVEAVTNNVAAINHAMKELTSANGLPVSIRLLHDSHRQLMRDVHGKNKSPGEARRSLVWIGGSRPDNAVFVPPPPEQVGALLSDLERYIHRPDDLPPLLRVAAAHVQFETIHPYLDGNGRIGRLLNTLLFSHWGILGEPLLCLSVFLNSNRRDYYNQLNAVRAEGNWVGWFRFFLQGVQDTADNAAITARALHKQVLADRRKLLASDLPTVSAIQLFEWLPTHPVVSMPLVTKLLRTSKPTASKAIGLLESCGLLTEIGARQRNRDYGYEACLAILK